MNINELSQLVGLIALGDNRTVDTNILYYWEQILPETLPFDIAKEAVLQHRRTSTEYLQPAHVIAISETLKQQDRARRRQLAAMTELEDARHAAANSLTRAAYAQLHPEDADKIPNWWHEPPKPPRPRGKRNNPTRIFQADDTDDEDDDGSLDAEPGV